MYNKRNHVPAFQNAIIPAALTVYFQSTANLTTPSPHQRKTNKSNYLFTLLNVKNAANNLHERFGEHCCFILNYGHFPNPTPLSKHFNQTGHSINNVFLIPLKLICSNHDSVRRAHKAHLINKAMTLEPHGINRCDELY